VGCVYRLENTYLNSYVQPQVLIGVVTGKHTFHALCATNINNTVFRYVELITYDFRPFEDFMDHILEHDAHLNNLVEQRQIRFDTYTLLINNAVFDKLNKTRVGRREINMRTWSRNMIDKAFDIDIPYRCSNDGDDVGDKISRLGLQRKAHIRENMCRYNLEYRKTIKVVEKPKTKVVDLSLKKGRKITVTDPYAIEPLRQRKTEVSVTITNRDGIKLRDIKVSMRVYQGDDMDSCIYAYDKITDPLGIVRVDLQHLLRSFIQLPISIYIRVYAGVSYDNKEVVWRINSKNGYKGVIILNNSRISEMVEEEDEEEMEVIKDVHTKQL